MGKLSQKYIKNIKRRATVSKNWVDIAYNHTEGGTLQTVEVSEITTFAAPNVRQEATMCSVLTRFTDGSVRQLRIGLLKEGDLWKIFWIGKIKVEQTFQDYIVRIYSLDYPSSISDWKGYFEILQGGHRVYIPGFYSGGSLIRLGQIDEDSKANSLIAMGKDITGNGTPNLVVSEWTLGASCCSVSHIFEIGRKFRKIARIDGNWIKFTDLDGDSRPEIVVGDYTFISWSSSRASYRPPDVILRYQDDGYRIAADLMQKPAPSREDLARRAQQSREPEGLYYTTMLELLYTGHPDLAWQYFEMAWPPDVSGKDEWLSKFRSELEGSQYWPLDSKRAYFVP